MWERNQSNRYKDRGVLWWRTFKTRYILKHILKDLFCCSLCVRACICACICVCPQKPEKDARSFGSGVTGDCWPPSLGTGDWTQVLLKSRKCVVYWDISLPFEHVIFEKHFVKTHGCFLRVFVSVRTHICVCCSRMKEKASWVRDTSQQHAWCALQSGVFCVTFTVCLSPVLSSRFPSTPTKYKLRARYILERPGQTDETASSSVTCCVILARVLVSLTSSFLKCEKRY